MAINVLELYEERMNSSIAMEVIQACKDALAQPTAEQSSLVQEPVCWMMTLPDGNHDWILDGNRFEGYIPLYTTPPSREWQSLSDAEIEEATGMQNQGFSSTYYMVIRAIEAKLKEKNELFGNSR
jgi:hypothetical protein